MSRGEARQTKAPWRGLDRTTGLALAVSLALHGVLAILLMSSIGTRPVLDEPAPQVIAIELIEVQVASAPSAPAQVQEDFNRVEDETTGPEEDRPTSPRPAVVARKAPSPDNAENQDNPMKAYRAVLRDAACPRFIDPQDLHDLDLSERCKDRSRQVDLRGESNPATAKVAGHIAATSAKSARAWGWDTSAPEITLAQQIIEQESQRTAPASDVFGPWPWERQ